MHQFGPDAIAGGTEAVLTRIGAVVMVRFASEADADALQAYFRGLSPRSRYNRLMGAASELPTGLLDAFTHPRNDGRYSMLATMLIDGVERIVGEARYAFDERTAHVELGLSVADAWQGQGLGLALLSSLQGRAVALGADTLFGDTLRSNDAMQALARKAGFKFAPTPGDWKQVRFEKRIGHPGFAPHSAVLTGERPGMTDQNCSVHGRISSSELQALRGCCSTFQ